MPDSIPLFNVYDGFWSNMAYRSLAANMDCEGVEIKTLDLIFFQKGVGRTVQKALKEYQPSLVGLTGMTFQYGSVKRIARQVRDFDRDIKIAFGGYHATLTYDEIAKNQDSELFDYIVRGEGEITFNELVKSFYSGNTTLEGILGLSFKKEGHFIHNEPRPLQDLDKIKPPLRSGLDLFEVNHGAFGKSEVIETSRGCTYKCDFCSIRHMYGSTFRKYKIERVIQDIKNAKKAGVVRMMFGDDNITLDAQNLKNLCDAIVENGLNDIYYTTQVDVNGIARDEALAKRLRQANFGIIFIGIESPLKRNLYQLNKAHTIERSGRAVSYLRKHDIAVMGGFIVGNPDDTKSDLDAAFKFSMEVGCDLLFMQILTPYPKTRIRETLLDSRMAVNTSDYSEYNGVKCNVRTRHLSRGQIMRKVSFGNATWYARQMLNPENWFNKSKRVPQDIKETARRMTLELIVRFYLGGFGKSEHRF